MTKANKRRSTTGCTILAGRMTGTGATFRQTKMTNDETLYSSGRYCSVQSSTYYRD